MPSAMVLVIFGHPAEQSFSDVPAAAYMRGLRAAHAKVETLVLRELRFDPHLRAGFSGAQPLEPDLRSAQSAIECASHVAWFFPTWWAGPPALVKAFVDRTFLPGWAFKYEGKALPTTLLRGRSSRVVTTMDSPRYWYQLWHRSSVHASFVNATLKYVGFGPVRCTTIYEQKALSEVERRSWFSRLEALGERDGARVNAARQVDSAQRGPERSA
jgi:NAD(P)H dehydrogenase (quinone)